MKPIVEFRHGLFAESYEKQANEQGYTLGNKAGKFDEIASAIKSPWIYSGWTAKQRKIIRDKIRKKLLANLKPLRNGGSDGTADAH